MKTSSAALAGLALLLLAESLTVPPARAACGKACQLILRGYKRDRAGCRKKWQGFLEQCKSAGDPNPSNGCGFLTTSSTSTSTTSTTSTSTTEPPPVCVPTTTVSTSTSSTTYPPCSSSSAIWARCGSPDRNCSCHHANEGASYDRTCVEAGTQAVPVYQPCDGCSTNQDCKDCLNDQQATDVCIKGPGDPPLGACVPICE
jgi:hypothetical protein